ncbi:MAG: NAD(P)/FAD-dependent oxidoreductase [Peptoniphilaceae bacterium]|nr:NAD(P)/FAD-dependent oxidoreductase [Peptoniphilaceae bacterium]MDY3737781.1 NAD(P)/FAD-dependent oxidoreductase [Peptoniphilaceae bacterium]
MKLAIIGAGPSGMFAALNAKTSTNEVYLFEKNKFLGKKLLITGGGRCNITNNSKNQFFSDNIINGKKFLHSSLSQFSNFDLIKFLERHGIKLYSQGNKIFPKSQNSKEILNLLIDLLKEKGIKIITETEIEEISFSDFFILKTNLGVMNFDKVLIATGGFSHQETGSTGDGYRFSKKFGHSIFPLKPALSSILVKNSFVKNISGVSLKNVEVFIKEKNKRISEFGDVVFTFNGISGPAVLNISSKINRKKFDKIYIDLYPQMNNEDILKKFNFIVKEKINMNIKNILKSVITESMLDIILKKSGVDKNKKGNQITKEEKNMIIHTLKFFDLDFLNFNKINFATVTSGGVNLKEINPKTMESKLKKNLYFAGEVMNIDALSGGFNLQLAFSTGFVAGINMGENNER